jgi:DNA-binding CsgD family transcriptional regulator
MGSERARARCRERIEALADATTDLDSVRREAIGELRRAIGFDRWCVLLVDPDTLLMSRGIGHNDWARDLPRLNVEDAGTADVNSLVVLARSRDHAAALRAATGGDLARSSRWREILSPYGVGDELRAAAVDEYGCWGDILLWRDSDDRPFDPDDARLMRDASRLIARALRRGAVAPSPGTGSSPPETGVLLLDDALRPCGSTASARAWFDALNPARMPLPDGIPTSAWSAVGRLLAAERGEAAERPARIRVRTGDGGWAVVEASRVDTGASAIAVTFRSAAPDEVLALISRAHGLSARERELVALLVEGLDTREIADRLFISRYTVQDHLKSVFEKVGVRSRRELVSGAMAHAA